MHIPEVLELVRTGAFKPSKVTTHLARWNEAIQVLPSHTAVKVVIARPEVLNEEARSNNERQDERRGQRPN